MQVANERNIRHLSLEEITDFFESMGEKKFRAKQVYEWLWQKHAHSFADMTNLSKELRQKLGETFTLPALAVDATQYSADGRTDCVDGHKDCTYQRTHGRSSRAPRLNAYWKRV